MAEVGSPTVRRRELGALLRSLRLQQGLNVDQVAVRLMCSPSKVSRLETGQRGVTPRDARDLCDLYGITDPEERDRIMRLASEGRQSGWWQYHDLDGFATYVGLEAEAAVIRYFQSTVVPGLMHTRGYARAMHQADVPEKAPERIDELVEVRLTRQRIISGDKPVQLEVVLDEAVLHRAVGGPEVMGEQLDRIIELTTLPNVTVQVIPFSVGAHPAMESTFNILDFTGAMRSVVYVEGLVGWVFFDRPQDIARYRQIFEHLCVIALNPQESSELMQRVRAGYQR